MTDDITPEDELLDMAEESWEAEIGNLLGGLPMIDPPDGFIDSALDHRPKFAGRTSLLAVLGSVVVVVVVSMSGLLKEQTHVPDLEALLSRHSVTEANLLGNVLVGSESGDSPVFRLKDSEEDFPYQLPEDLEWSAVFESQDLKQAVLEFGGETVSVFVKPGRVDFDSLPAADMMEIAGVTVWSDPDNQLLIAQSSNAVITVVGLDPMLLELLVARLEAENDPSQLERLAREVDRVTSQLGFPDLD